MQGVVQLNLEHYRDQINEIDLELLKLINKRAQLALKISEVKQEKGLPIYIPEREQSILLHLIELNQGPLNATGINSIFTKIIEACRQLQLTQVD